jgi:hypothetical protein
MGILDRYSLRWPRDILYPLKLALTSAESGGRSVDIVRLRTKATEFVFCDSYETRFCDPVTQYARHWATEVIILFMLPSSVTGFETHILRLPYVLMVSVLISFWPSELWHHNSLVYSTDVS